MTEPSLRLSGISKRYPGVQALRDVSLECVAGEVHAVLGENGSGKSTLLKIASGALAPDEGTIDILGDRLTSADTLQAHRFGLATVYQDNSLVPELTVAQNLYLGTMGEALTYRRVQAWARDQLAPYDLAIDASARVADLSPAQRQFLEVVKALVSKPRVLLLDEPTASLDVNDVEALHRIVRRIVAEGTTVVYVSHRLPEILDLAQRVTVLRDGEGQGTFETLALSEDDLIALMVGRPIEAEFPPKRGAGILSSEVCLAARALSGDAFSDVSFEVHRGEILGFAGAEGNGQREVLRAAGGFEDASGTLTCEDRRIPLAAPQRSLGAGVLMLSGDRAVESIYPALSVRENITIQVLKDFASASVVSGRRERGRTRDMIEELDIVTASLEQPISSLSGGNQQKCMLARSFLHGAMVVLIDEPTQGVDAAARFDIYQAIRAKADSGTTFVINSSDALELAGLCDRVLVFSRGRLIRELVGDEVSEENIVSSFLTSAGGADDGSRRRAEHVRNTRRLLRRPRCRAARARPRSVVDASGLSPAADRPGRRLRLEPVRRLPLAAQRAAPAAGDRAARARRHGPAERASGRRVRHVGGLADEHDGGRRLLPDRHGGGHPCAVRRHARLPRRRARGRGHQRNHGAAAAHQPGHHHHRHAQRAAGRGAALPAGTDRPGRSRLHVGIAHAHRFSPRLPSSA